MLKKLLTAFPTLFLICGIAFMPNANAYYSRYSYDYDNDPSYVLMSAVDKIKQFSSKSNSAPPAMIRGFLEKEIIPMFDFDNMSRWITGPYVQYMSGSDKAEFQMNLKDAFLSSLSKHLGTFDADHTRLRYYPARYRNNGEAVVTVQVNRSGQFPARLNFRMRQNPAGWKIIDVTANGTSAVIYYRRHFIEQLKGYGG